MDSLYQGLILLHIPLLVVLLAVRVRIRVKSRPTSPFTLTILEQVKGSGDMLGLIDL